MPLEPAPQIPKKKPVVKATVDGPADKWPVKYEVPPRSWLLSELVELYLYGDDMQAAHMTQKKDILLKLLDMTGNEEDELVKLFIPDISDIDKINKQIGVIQVESLIVDAMRSDKSLKSGDRESGE